MRSRFQEQARVGRQRRRWVIGTAATVMGLAVAGCAGDSTESGGATRTSGTPLVQPVGRGKPVTNYLDYVGGRAGKADSGKSPITIGWVNAQGGQQEFAEATSGAQAAVSYVNAELGGIDGHPLRLATCFIASAEEEGQRCGQQLLNDKSVPVIAFGAVVTGNQSLEAVVAGKKPIVAGVSVSPADGTAKNAYLLYGDQTHVLAAWGTYARDIAKAKTAAVIYPTQPGFISAAQARRKGLEDAGLKVKSVGYDPNATDLLGPLTAAGAQSADVIVPATDAPGCVNVAKAIEQSGIHKPVIAGPLCLDPRVSAGLGDIPVGWIFGIAQTLPADPSAPDARTYRATATRNGLKQSDVTKPFAAFGWDESLIITKLMNGIGADKVSASSMTAALRNFNGPLIMGAPSIDCGKYPAAPAVCNDQTKFYRYEGKGKFTAVSDWLRPPK